MAKLVFIDVDDTLIGPPHKAIRRAARFFLVRNFPSEEQVLNRTHVDYDQAFPEVFKTKGRMWAMVLASIPFGFVKSQSLFPVLNRERLKDILSDPRVFLISQNPPFLSRSRIKHLEKISGAKIGDRYIACGPIKGPRLSKTNIIKAICHLYDVQAENCLLVDDHVNHLREAASEGVNCRLVDSTWNRTTDQHQRINRSDLTSVVDDFFGDTQSPLKNQKLRFVFPEETQIGKLTRRKREWAYKYRVRHPLIRRSPRTRGTQDFSQRVVLWTPYGFSLPIPAAPQKDQIQEAYRCLNLVKQLGSFSPEDDVYTKQELKAKIAAELGTEFVEKNKKPFDQYCEEMLSSRSQAGVSFTYRVVCALAKAAFRKVIVKTRQPLRELERTHFVVYTPHHRSIYDSALLMKVLKEEASSMPVVPAADKMKKNIVGFSGQFIGTFYIRRQKVDAVYKRVMNEVVKHAVQYSSSSAIFLEGQRSRSGLTLSPKAGVLKMILTHGAGLAASDLSPHGRPIVIVPVSFAYNKLPESEILLDEVFAEMEANNKASIENQSDMLIRKARNRPSVFKFLKRMVQKKVSDAYVTFGPPIPVVYPSGNQFEEKDLSDYLSKIMIETNCVVPPIATSIACLAILSAKKNHLYAEDLVVFMNFSGLVIGLYPGGFYKQVVCSSGSDFIEELNDLPFINRKFKVHQIAQKDIISITDIDIVVAAHYQNNILHYFAGPASLARLVNRTGSGDLKSLEEKFAAVLTPLSAHFFMREPAHFSEYFKKLMYLFSIVGAVDLEGDQYRYKRQDSSSPFAVLCSIAETLGNHFEPSQKDEKDNPIAA